LVEKKEFKVKDLSPFFGKASISFLMHDTGLSGLQISVNCNGDHITDVETDKDGKVTIEGLRMGEFCLSRKTEEEKKDDSADNKSKDEDEKLERALFDPEEEGFSDWPFSDDGEVKLLAKSNQEPGIKHDMPASSVATKGELVTKLQKTLSKLGYDEFLGSAGADGMFGAGTRKAVIEFQRKHTYCDGSTTYSSSEPDGIVGRETAFAIDRAIRTTRRATMDALTEPGKLVLSMGRLEEREFTVKITSSAVEFRHQIEVEEPILVPVLEYSISV
jgi:putative peptidoglycan binding protein